MAFFESCECGEYDCSYCGPVIEAINFRDRLKAKEEVKAKKLQDKHNSRMMKECLKREMPYGKYKGQKLATLSPGYCYTLLSYKEQRDRLNVVLIEPLEWIASHYKPEVATASNYTDYQVQDPFDHALDEFDSDNWFDYPWGTHWED